MSASELIEQAKLLSPEDRERLIDSLLEMDFVDQPVATASKKVDWSDTIRRTKLIFGDRVLPNIVLEERESYNY
jgi:hypothetical protein